MDFFVVALQIVALQIVEYQLAIICKSVYDFFTICTYLVG